MVIIDFFLVPYSPCLVTSITNRKLRFKIKTLIVTCKAAYLRELLIKVETSTQSEATVAFAPFLLPFTLLWRTQWGSDRGASFRLLDFSRCLLMRVRGEGGSDAEQWIQPIAKHGINLKEKKKTKQNSQTKRQTEQRVRQTSAPPQAAVIKKRHLQPFSQKEAAPCVHGNSPGSSHTLCSCIVLSPDLSSEWVGDVIPLSWHYVRSPAMKNVCSNSEKKRNGDDDMFCEIKFLLSPSMLSIIFHMAGRTDWWKPNHTSRPPPKGW